MPTCPIIRPVLAELRGLRGLTVAFTDSPLGGERIGVTVVEKVEIKVGAGVDGMTNIPAPAAVPMLRSCFAEALERSAATLRDPNCSRDLLLDRLIDFDMD